MGLVKVGSHVDLDFDHQFVPAHKFDTKYSYKLVGQRSPLKDKEGKQQTDMFGVIYTYRCILTNNWMATEKDIITFYNERGASEKNFDIQNNDFGWSHLPFFLHGWEHGFHDDYRHAEELLSRPSYQRKGQAVEKDKQAESLYPAFCQRASKMGAHRKAERSEPLYQ